MFDCVWITDWGLIMSEWLINWLWGIAVQYCDLLTHRYTLSHTQLYGHTSPPVNDNNFHDNTKWLLFPYTCGPTINLLLLYQKVQQETKLKAGTEEHSNLSNKQPKQQLNKHCTNMPAARSLSPNAPVDNGTAVELPAPCLLKPPCWGVDVMAAVSVPVLSCPPLCCCCRLRSWMDCWPPGNWRHSDGHSDVSVPDYSQWWS